MFIINLIRGFFMALADSVPGVSGGTIAFILGFYDEFIGSLNTLVSKSSREDKGQALQFLLKIGIGWALGMILSVLFLSSIFEEHIYSISSVFIGFILFSIPLIIKAEKETIKNKYLNYIFLNSKQLIYTKRYDTIYKKNFQNSFLPIKISISTLKKSDKITRLSKVICLLHNKYLDNVGCGILTFSESSLMVISPISSFKFCEKVFIYLLIHLILFQLK